MARFADRRAAGRELGRRLSQLAGLGDPIVLGLARGGVPVAAEVASLLGAEFDVLVVRKLGVPGQPELAFGALASGGARVLNREVIAEARLTPAAIDAVVERERRALAARERLIRPQRPAIELSARHLIVVDDGLATGATMRAALAALRERRPARIVAAAPVGAAETCHGLEALADEVVCLHTPRPFAAVGLHYDDFRPTTEAELRRLLAQPGGG